MTKQVVINIRTTSKAFDEDQREEVRRILVELSDRLGADNGTAELFTFGGFLNLKDIHGNTCGSVRIVE